jgi:hypothetical protein
MALAQELGAVPRQVAAIVKTAVWEGLELPLERALELERRLAQRLKAGGGGPATRKGSITRKGHSFPPASGGN